MSDYTTKVTNLGKHGYGCRVFYQGKLVVEGRASSRLYIGSTFRDLLRTMDKTGGDQYTNAARHRNSKNGNLCIGIKHYWGGKPKTDH